MFKFTNRKGKEVTLLNPNERARKYANELKDGVHYTNNNEYKFDPNTGVIAALTDTQRSYRSGYLAARKDSANAYKHNKKKNRK